MENPENIGELLFNPTTYGFQRVEGLVSLERRKVFLEGELAAGDNVVLFSLPDGRYMLSKAEGESDLRIEKITPAYISFDGEITVQEE